MRIHVIVAPHGDDEIIGCHGLLLRAQKLKEVVRVFYPVGLEGELGRQKMSEMFNAPIIGDLDNLLKTSHGYGVCLHAPDVRFEKHPTHRQWGARAEQLFREGRVAELQFYTTNMEAPYTFEVPSPDMKQLALNNCYPEKKSLWEYDHRYFLFEGTCEWHRPYGEM